MIYTDSGSTEMGLQIKNLPCVFFYMEYLTPAPGDFTAIYVMLILETGEKTDLCIIQGPVGRIQILDLVWITDRQDLLEIYYWEAWAVLQGCYHCCLSIPGKVQLLPA